MPVNNDVMNTTTIVKIWLLTPIAAFAVKPRRLPTTAWSTIPCRPPMMLVSIVGHARRQTALRRLPSMIERSHLRRWRGGVGGTDGAAAFAEVGVREGVAVTSVIGRICLLAS